MAAAAAATSSSTSTSSSSHQQPPAAAAVKIGLEIGLFRPPGSLLLRLILRHFRHEIRWCFAASDVFRKRCLAVSFLLERLVDCSSSTSSSSGSHQQPPAAAVKIGFLVGFQKGRSGPQGVSYCDWFCAIFGTKLGRALLLRMCFEKVVVVVVWNGNCSCSCGFGCCCSRSWSCSCSCTSSTSSTSSTAQGDGGSFKNRTPIGEVGCCESRMAERIHWWTERWLRSPLFLSLSLTIYLPTYRSIYLSFYLSPSLSLICLSNYLTI